MIRLASVDLDATAEISDLQELFDFGRDYLGLLKAAVIASGIVPPGLEGSGQPLSSVLRQLMQRDGLGIEIVSQREQHPQGFAAGCLNQPAGIADLGLHARHGAGFVSHGFLTETDRRLVAARAILGEWLGGSGGGWQDSGGVWPGIKLIEGVLAAEGDPEFGISRGRLLPNHRILTDSDVSKQTRQRLQDSLVLVHGGMAQDVGPILEMVTERYLLRSDAEWTARQSACRILDEITADLRKGDVPAIARRHPAELRRTDPDHHSLGQQSLYRDAHPGGACWFGKAFWGFWMLGGMSGGGMGFIFDPARKAEAQNRLDALMPEIEQQARRRRGLCHEAGGLRLPASTSAEHLRS